MDYNIKSNDKFTELNNENNDLINYETLYIQSKYYCIN